MPDHAIAHVEGVVNPSMRFIRRREAAKYLTDKYGFGAYRTLLKGAVSGDTPAFHKAGRIVLYTREALDVWALAKISGPLKSTSEAAAVRAFAPSEPDLANVRTIRGDFDEAGLAEAMDRPAITGDIVETYRNRGEGRSSLCFCVNRRHAQHIAERFFEAGVAAEYMDGDP
jgi:hypothetical protein